ncbi:MAG: DUF3883 domain-containing protein [Deltaproteobacteria bacterium]|nr:DUF3883 domain-containing protein [Deltaproteobacteria bacterium]
MQIKPGDIIQSPRWDEPIEVKLVENLGDYVKLIAVTVHSRRHIDQLIKHVDLEDAKISKVDKLFGADPQHVFLSLEAKRYRYADLYDPLLAVNTSKVDPLPHQVEAVYGYVLKLPRIRFLIADDPGAGKTIMAGLIIKELKLRRLVNRILIVVPGHLKDQWRRELNDRFEEKFVVIDRSLMDMTYGENVWDRENQIITSIDFCKRDDILPSLSSTQFDLIIADEAHKMSAYRYGDKTSKTGRYRLGETLSRIGVHMLFLTATPHRGDPENFRLFLDLLQPGFFANTEMLEDSISQRDNPLFISRLKEDLKNFEGEPLFLPRHVKTIPFDLGSGSPLEKDLYNKLSAYVNTQYNKALSKDKRRNVAFALVILQRRFASSVFAVWRSLERRKKRLTELLVNFQNESNKDVKTFDFEAIEDSSEEDRWKEEELWETLSVAENREELQKEIGTLEGLIVEARNIIDSDSEIKLSELKSTLENLNNGYPGKKILIFTESRDTLDYLYKRIQSWGYSANTIHGGMGLENRIDEERRFRNETQIMIATEAAGEGINLQFCNLMINYDIPWNPNRLEQRMGRIHRYGQTQEVFVFNLVAQDTREGAVLTRLFKKIDEIKEALGNDKVFDVLSEVLYGKNLSQIMIEAAANARSLEEILAEMDIVVDEDYIAKVRENLGDSLATHYIDYTQIKELAQRARESRLIPEYTEAFFKKAFELVGGKVKTRKDGMISLDGVPAEFRNLGDEDSFKRRYGSVLRAYPRVTFSKDVAFKTPDSEFVSFGHPVFEAALLWVEKNLTMAASQGAVFYDPDGKLHGLVFFYETEIVDGVGQVAGKRLFAMYYDEDTNEVRPVNPAFLWDLANTSADTTELIIPAFDLDALKMKMLTTLIPTLEDYKSELETERNRQANIKEKYGAQSLEYLILQLDSDLITLADRESRGDDVGLVIRNKTALKDHYDHSLKELRIAIEKEKTLTMASPVFLGLIYVRPELDKNLEAENDPEIEKIGMDLTMKVERDQGRFPEDVSAQNLGYDVRSTDSLGKVRYIEVKARSGQGYVALTQNEWFKAKRFGDDYYLYAVFNAATNPRLVVVQNPALNLTPESVLREVRHIIGFDQVFTVGQKLKYLQ